MLSRAHRCQAPRTSQLTSIIVHIRNNVLYVWAHGSYDNYQIVAFFSFYDPKSSWLCFFRSRFKESQTFDVFVSLKHKSREKLNWMIKERSNKSIADISNVVVNIVIIIINTISRTRCMFCIQNIYIILFSSY